MLVATPLLAAVTLVVQTPVREIPAADPPPPARSVRAVRAPQQPTIDGRDDDVVWRDAVAIRELQEWRPSEGGTPKQPTEVKVAYDAANLYVLVRCFDAHPDSIITVLARRDYFTPSDMVWLFIDSYHDRRTGFEFGVNPSGVKM
ncbi:MAG TPA: sugar-binding protein, partial [Gemmatimonadales bacterium]